MSNAPIQPTEREARLENKISYTFTKKELLREALTHRSYLNENPSWSVSNNERLEYLGDAVLELVITENLFNQFPDKPEGVLTALRAALVNYVTLARSARNIQLDDYLYLSKGELKDTGRAREAILADSLEALIGALHLDGGYAPARKLIDTYIFPHLKEIIETQGYKDPKSQLQEIVQEQEKITPTYKVLKEHGPDHNLTFKVGAYLNNTCIAEGTGRSKQEAETDAAQNALEDMGKKSQK